LRREQSSRLFQRGLFFLADACFFWPEPQKKSRWFFFGSLPSGASGLFSRGLSPFDCGLFFFRPEPQKSVLGGVFGSLASEASGLFFKRPVRFWLRLVVLAGASKKASLVFYSAPFVPRLPAFF